MAFSRGLEFGLVMGVVGGFDCEVVVIQFQVAIHPELESTGISGLDLYGSAGWPDDMGVEVRGSGAAIEDGFEVEFGA